ncbi:MULTISPECIES: menaquinone biosynthesis prenyltransferase MqnP [Campylobacter]|uniref:menaquinone biosynthesis prenyltransferase MqnP n=1 Tax=Campylobacter TaxID=194 RepID=UPI0023F43D8E|nr:MULTISPECIES: menaquinone biosynthesis prenyltransferase MqnP [Campylobacter]MCI6641304.1 4-hydroxybenzoate polyprenyltransferase [Campylobacter sp.]MDD7423246.1 4-hydroxybenzoate polyprenyltransferase [Campylobacter hominis]MDY3117674.1 menaquinone biosynthesis prenyltransferase MqnP [Campylobacter hominis]
MGKFKQILCDISELIVFKHSIFSLTFIFTAMITASKILNNSMWFGFKLLILGILCAVSARNFAMACNRLIDEDIDRPNPRCANRPSVDGRIGRGNLILFIVLNGIFFVVVSYFINSLAFKLSFVFLFLLFIYSFFKRFSSTAHIMLGVCSALAPLAGAIAVLGYIPLWSLLLACASAFWVGGFDILYSLQDIDYDRKAGLYSIPSIYGENASLFISALFHAVTVLFWLFYAGAAGLGFWAYSGIIISALILVKEHRIVRKDFSKIDRAFFTLNGYLGIMFFIFIFIDLWN